MGNNNNGSMLRNAIAIGSLTFILAIIITFVSNMVVNRFQNILLASTFLLLIIVLGIVFDMIGVAATAADITPFHAKAAKKVSGAKQSIALLRNADKVASFCNDVVGDICGTVSGALATGLVIMLLVFYPEGQKSIFDVVLTGWVAALTVGGKAVGKSLAINQAEAIIFKVGQALAWLEELTGIRIFSDKRNRKIRERVTR